MRAKQILAINQSLGRFTRTDYDTFIGTGGRADLPQESPGNQIRVPRATTRRDLSTIQAKYLPFPGRIYFTSAQAGDLFAAFRYFMGRFNKEAPNSGDPTKKSHQFSYKRSLLISVNGKVGDPSSVISQLENPGPQPRGTLIEIINYAPHAATIEVDIGVMYDIAIATYDAFGPAVTVSYDYVNSDSLGVYYGRGTGGPGPETAAATSRPYPVVYALPRVRLALNAGAQGVSNSRFVRPGRKVSYRVKRMRAPARARG